MTQPSIEWRRIMELTNGFMPTCVIGAAAELDLFSILADEPMTAQQLVERIDADPRATRVLLDAVASLDLLHKEGEVYSVPEAYAPFLVRQSEATVLPMILHRTNIMRGWSQMAWVAKSGIPAQRQASIRGEEADREAFVAAMHSVSRVVADGLVARLGPPEFSHLLDVGGASGTWAMAFLRAMPDARATLFDLPDAVELARDRITRTKFADRITLVAGDFYIDDLPAGADLAWVSAICHQHSRRHNQELFGKVHKALVPGGRIGIREVVMESCRTRPQFGAMFAVNMVANTEFGGTFTFDELAEDFLAAGFADVQLAEKAGDMNSVVMAKKL